MAVGAGGQTTDQSGALLTLVDEPFGKVLVGLLAVGLLGYALWRLAQAILDTGGELGRRLGVRRRVQRLPRRRQEVHEGPERLRHGPADGGVARRRRPRRARRRLRAGRRLPHEGGVEYDPKEAQGLDGALARLADQPYGAVLLGLATVGLLACAAYCIADARYRDSARV